jgi:hypothetical protein
MLKQQPRPAIEIPMDLTVTVESFKVRLTRHQQWLKHIAPVEPPPAPKQKRPWTEPKEVGFEGRASRILPPLYFGPKGTIYDIDDL